MLKPIKKESVRVQVFWQLRDQILRRTWPPGSKLPSEKELCQTMGVSRVSIREGIQHLVSLGILETRHGEGTFVREWSREQSTGSARLEALRRKALAHPMSLAEDNVIRAIQSAHSLEAKR